MADPITDAMVRALMQKRYQDPANSDPMAALMQQNQLNQMAQPGLFQQAPMTNMFSGPWQNKQYPFE